MRFRKLRIAFSATCLVACVLLIALWVRSYKHDDALQAHSPSSSPLVLRSFKGQLSFWRWHGVNAARRIPTKSLNEDLDEILSASRPPRFYWGFARIASPLAGVVVPHWFPVLISAALAAIPWLPWWSNRFSLRTLSWSEKFAIPHRHPFTGRRFASMSDYRNRKRWCLHGSL
jgi:hypothetical protein